LSKFGLAAIALVAALLLSFGVRSAAPTAHADVDDTAAVYCGLLLPYQATACDGVLTMADLRIIAGDDDADGTIEAGEGDNEFGDEDGVFEKSDLADIEGLDANQVTEQTVATGVLDTIYLFVFVDDDGIVVFDTETGATPAVNDDGGADEAAPAADTDIETCTGADDEDCGTTVDDNGDGVVVATITTTTADEGDAVDVDVSQEGNAGGTETLNVVGAADDVTVTLVETTIQSDASADCGDGTLEVTDSDALSNPDSTIAIAVVTDNDGRELTRIPTTFDSSDTDVALIGDDTVVSVDGGDSGIAAFAVVCGDDTTGTADISADIGVDDDSQEITVVGEPASVALTASPAQIACDGSQTATVTATVTDSEGNNVANGTGVTFSVVALGTANPINTTTTDGTASSTITPLSGATAGVTVVVSSGSASSSIRVDCSLPIPPTTNPNATPTRPGGIVGPDTGSGGYLGQDSSAGFPLWTLVALALGSVVLVAGGLVTRRAGR
jgi:hypothetical protein